MGEIMYELTDYQCVINSSQCFNEIAPLASEDDDVNLCVLIFTCVCTICLVFKYVQFWYKMRAEEEVQEFREPIKSISCPPEIKCNCRVDNPSSLTDNDLLSLIKVDKNRSNEAANEYKWDGYMPLELGAQIGPQRNFTIIKKLGYGSFSTVWLSYVQSKKMFCALKISKAGHIDIMSSRQEIYLLNQINNANPNHAGSQKVVKILGYFTAPSIYGNHICIIMELLGPSLANLIDLTGLRGFEPNTVKKIIKQVLLGLVYLHDICGIIHTDLKPENIIVVKNNSYAKNMLKTVKKFNDRGIAVPNSYVCSSEKLREEGTSSIERDDFSDFDIYRLTIPSYPFDKYNEPERNDDEITGESKAVKYVSRPAFINPDLKIKIADLGNAVIGAENTCRGTIQTRGYRALEVILGAEFSFSADIWSVGCIAYELLSGDLLFPIEQTKMSYKEQHLILIVEIIGAIPKDIAVQNRLSKAFFRSDGQLIYSKEAPASYRSDLIKFFTENFGWNNEDATSFKKFLVTLLEPDPTLRITAANALKAPWLNEQN